ncbi:ankyrin repeat domain-containing protein [Candidatus Sororendozoicomonas aggregata]|uniref:ankyrin repeat domain-containing protein n=1 Tax=Candidatus Sororendozoicomonas aggregata TaxID=3073239 RepID=UPI002ED59550
MRFKSINEAISFGSLDEMKRFLEEGVSINNRGDYNMTPLMVAAYRGKLRLLSYLIQLGADLNLVDKYGQTALICSITSPFTHSITKVRMVHALLGAGANPNIGVAWHVSPPSVGLTSPKYEPDKDIWGCFGQAIKRREFDIAQMCLDYGARPLPVSKIKSAPVLSKTLVAMVNNPPSLESQTIRYIREYVSQDKIAELGLPPALLKGCFGLPNTPVENPAIEDEDPLHSLQSLGINDQF